MNTYITIHHDKAIFNVLPANAQRVHDTLALIDKSKGLKGPKFNKTKPWAPANKPANRRYPVFEPGMDTSEYLRVYQMLNSHFELIEVKYTYADRPAPMLDPSYPEVLEEVEL